MVRTGDGDRDICGDICGGVCGGVVCGDVCGVFSSDKASLIRLRSVRSISGSKFIKGTLSLLRISKQTSEVKKHNRPTDLVTGLSV